MTVKRSITLILLRPDGTNRTWQMTRGRITFLIAVSVTVVVVATGLLYWTYWNRQRYRDLADRYELLAGREVLALSPQPTPVDDIPGAAEFPVEATMISGGTVPSTTPLQRPVRRPERPFPEETGPDEAPGSVRESPVRIVGLRIVQINSGAWEVSADLTKSEQDGEVLRGFIAVLLEDLSKPGEYLTQPPMTLREGRPITPQAGESFAIRRFKPLRYRFEPPEDFRIGTVRFVVYDRAGALLLDRVFEVGGRA